MAIYNYFTGKIDLNQRIPLLKVLSYNRGKGEQRSICGRILAPCPMRDALRVLLNADGEFDEEGRAFGFVISYADISVVIRDDGVDNGQP